MREFHVVVDEPRLESVERVLDTLVGDVAGHVVEVPVVGERVPVRLVALHQVTEEDERVVARADL